MYSDLRDYPFVSTFPAFASGLHIYLSINIKNTKIIYVDTIVPHYSGATVQDFHLTSKNNLFQLILTFKLNKNKLLFLQLSNANLYKYFLFHIIL